MDVGIGVPSYESTVTIPNTTSNVILMLGSIPTLLEKVIELGTPTQLKNVASVSLSGEIAPSDANYGLVRLHMYSPNFQEIERKPFDDRESAEPTGHFDGVQENKGTYIFRKSEVPQHGKLSLRISAVFHDFLRLRTLNLDVR
jgi:hypothetical protein